MYVTWYKSDFDLRGSLVVHFWLLACFLPRVPQEGQTRILIDRSLSDVYNGTWTLDGTGVCVGGAGGRGRVGMCRRRWRASSASVGRGRRGRVRCRAASRLHPNAPSPI